jgi:signal transduction histidine kinase
MSEKKNRNISSFFSRLARLGTNSSYPPSRNQVIYTGNIASLVGFAVAVFNIWYFPLTYHSAQLFWLTLASLLGCCTVIPLSWSGHSLLGRTFFWIFETSLIFLVSDSFGPNSRVNSFLLATGLVTLLIFDKRTERAYFVSLLFWNSFLLLLNLAVPGPVIMPLIPHEEHALAPVFLSYAASLAMAYKFAQKYRAMMAELIASQEKLVLAAKMASLGEMAGGIAHEINSPLSAIRTNAEATRDYFSTPPHQDSFGRERAERIVSVSDRIFRIIRGLRSFSRTETGSPKKSVAIADIVNDTLDLCRERLKSQDVALRVEQLCETPVLCRPDQISQVLLNLLSNSLKAIGNQSSKWISISSRQEGGFVLVSVTDSGTGIPDSVASRMMEPFFSTRELGEGAGLGLSMSLGIIKDHGGELAYSLFNGHTRFTFSLPTSGGLRPENSRVHSPT